MGVWRYYAKPGVGFKNPRTCNYRSSHSAKLLASTESASGIYAGFPTAVNAVLVAKEVFQTAKHNQYDPSARL